MPAPATSRVRGNQELQRAFKLPPDSKQAVMNRHQDASGFVLEVACNRVMLTEWRIPYASDSQFLASVLVERVICPEMVPSATGTPKAQFTPIRLGGLYRTFMARFRRERHFLCAFRRASLTPAWKLGIEEVKQQRIVCMIALMPLPHTCLHNCTCTGHTALLD